MEDNSVAVPAGWYPDPLQLPQLRWWNSTAWTEHTSTLDDDDELADEAEVGPSAEPEIRPLAAAEHTNRTATAPILGDSSADEVSPQRHSHYGHSYSAAVWVIATLPLLQLLTSVFLIAVVRLGSNLPLLIVVWTAPYAVVLCLAAYDNLLLRAWGHQHPASAGWALLTAPAYLIVRGIRTTAQTSRGAAPIAIWFASVVVVALGVVVLPGVLISLLPQFVSANIERSIQVQAQPLGAELTVSCPATPPLLIGDMVNCDAVQPSTAQRGTIVVSLQRENGWISWRVEDWGPWTLFGS